jgi:hypothetical protein
VAETLVGVKKYDEYTDTLGKYLGEGADG